MEDLFPSASKEEISKRKIDFQLHCSHSWSELQLFEQDFPHTFKNLFIQTKKYTKARRHCYTCKLEEILSPLEVVEYERRKRQEKVDWYNSLTTEQANLFIDQCYPSAIPHFTPEEFLIFKADPIVSTWFNFEVTSGQEWIWKKYSIIDRITEWRKVNSTVRIRADERHI